MAIQIIGIGTVADDGTGDSLRVAGDKINDNFNEIYTALGDGSTITGGAIIPASRRSIMQLLMNWLQLAQPPQNLTLKRT